MTDENRISKRRGCTVLLVGNCHSVQDSPGLKMQGGGKPVILGCRVADGTSHHHSSLRGIVVFIDRILDKPHSETLHVVSRSLSRKFTL